MSPAESEGSVYLLTLRNPKSRSWRIAGVFLDPTAVRNAKQYLIDQGIDSQFISIDQAPIGVVNTFGIDEPYKEALAN